MSFDTADYNRGAQRLKAPPINLMAVAAIESSGENFWQIDGKSLPPIRLEAHWFSNQSGHKYDQSHPDISSPSWRPELAATTKAGAWEQYRRAYALDPRAAAEATSWGPFQIMGFHWRVLGYPNVAAFVDAMSGPDDDGQMESFVRFVEADPRLLRAIQSGDWETWETAYNGGGYGGAYAAKIRSWLANHGSWPTPDSPSPTPPRVLRRGYKGHDVEVLQQALNIDADGDFGPATEASVLRFQSDMGLNVDGLVGIMTLRALRLAA